jgi:hypothetical protein
MTMLDTDQEQSKESQAWHGFAIQGRKETVQPIRFITGFGHNRLITAKQDDVISVKQMVSNKYPVNLAPANDCMVKALNGPIATPFLCPARDAQHGHPSGHR